MELSPKRFQSSDYNFDDRIIQTPSGGFVNKYLVWRIGAMPPLFQSLLQFIQFNSNIHTKLYFQVNEFCIQVM